MLESPFDLVPPAQVQEEGQRVDVERSADEDGNLTVVFRIQNGKDSGSWGDHLQKVVLVLLIFQSHLRNCHLSPTRTYTNSPRLDTQCLTQFDE